MTVCALREGRLCGPWALSAAGAPFRAARLASSTLLVALGEKNHAASRATPEAADRRNRAFTLLFRAYDEARRALTYLRWHEDDVDLIAPSLYQRTQRRRSASAGPTAVPGEEGQSDDAAPDRSATLGDGDVSADAPPLATTESAARARPSV